MELPIMQNIAKTREGLAQIGAACVELVRGCEGCQHTEIGVDELDYLVVALREMLAYAEKLRESAVSTAIEPALDHDGDTEPAHDKPDPPECLEDGASCDCFWHENLRAALESGGGVTR